MEFLLDTTLGYFVIEKLNSYNLKAKYIFTTHDEAVESLKKLQNNELPNNLKSFIENNQFKNLYAADKKFSKLIQKNTATKCKIDSCEIKKIKDEESFYKLLNLEKNHFDAWTVSIAHRLCQEKIKNNNNFDGIIINAVFLLEEMDSDINLKTMRIREWYGNHFPELEELFSDNLKYLKAIKLIGNRFEFLKYNNLNKGDIAKDSFSDEQVNCFSVEKKENSSINIRRENNLNIKSKANKDEKVSPNDSDKANILNDLDVEFEKNTPAWKLEHILDINKIIVNKIIELAEVSVGSPLDNSDLQQIIDCVTYIINHHSYREELNAYLSSRIESISPNLSALLGHNIASKLLSKMGSFSAMAKAPASTLQIQGAEKAFFTAIKQNGNTPKYGLLYNSDLVQMAEPDHRGKIARMLSAKIALCSRIDYFGTECKDNSFGIKARNEIINRISTFSNINSNKEKKNNKSTEKFKLKNKLTYVDIRDGNKRHKKE
ncbi:hypothetical protein EDEG_00340 [Edhazardia aedis USNM 41457]|uniref:Nucleolar protein 58 n=1 Tax=Edhazardia aedis (strain USNM 41457) TaxID=1003232 RepID=J8ZQ82_EDHAE|nr:hypothetical protein EDEG_00340 [Edhazardia aedis USNM 41457]|eukprot:EJW01853.1 hypothetical protein EDEG_00340 [Edhazardia aedis USNM 41457]